MNDHSQRDLQLLLSQRWDPRRGVGRRLGTIRAWLTTFFLIMIVFGRYITAGIATSPAGHVLGSIAYLFPAIGLILCWLIPWKIRARTKQRVSDHDGFLCPWCRYALTGLPDNGTCPECGVRYEKAICQKLYECIYRSYKPDQNEMNRRDRESWTRAIRLRDGITPPSPPDDSHPSPAN